MNMVKMSMQAPIIVLASFIVFLNLGVSLAHAQQAGIQIKPSIIEERVEPGQTYPFTLHITNRGSVSDTFFVTKRDITGIGEDGHPILADESEEKTGFESSTWISVGQESVEIPSGQERSIPITILVPSDATKGGYFASIIVTTNPPQLQGVGATVSYGAATIVALRVGGSAGDAVEEVNIREFRTDKVLYGSPEVTFITKVANIGNTLLRPRGPLEITDMFGKKVASLVVNVDGAAVLPKGERTFETSWKGEGLFFGRYQVVMSLGYGEDEKKTVSETLSFWVLPANVLIPVLVVAAVLIIGLFTLTKMHIKRKLRSMNVSANTARRSRGTVSRSALTTVVFLVCTLAFFLFLFAFFA
jgi:hypothetical protein